MSPKLVPRPVKSGQSLKISMNAQNVTVAIAIIGLASTILVQFINYLSNIHSKTLDAQQKQEDRDQELRKIYLIRKLEACEQIISRRVALIADLESNRYHYTKYSDDAAYFESVFESVIAESKARRKDSTDRIKSYLLYFDGKEASDSRLIADQYNNAEHLLNIKLQERSRILKRGKQDTSDTVMEELEDAFARKQVEIENLMPGFLELSEQLVQALLQSCDAIRLSMKKYDLL